MNNVARFHLVFKLNNTICVVIKFVIISLLTRNLIADRYSSPSMH